MFPEKVLIMLQFGQLNIPNLEIIFGVKCLPYQLFVSCTRDQAKTKALEGCATPAEQVKTVTNSAHL